MSHRRGEGVGGRIGATVLPVFVAKGRPAVGNTPCAMWLLEGEGGGCAGVRGGSGGGVVLGAEISVASLSVLC